MEVIKIKSNLGIAGKITVRRHPAGTIEKLKALHAEGRHAEAQELLKTGEIATTQKNIIVDSANRGIDLLIQWIISGANGSIYHVGPSYGDIGTGQTVPTTADTALAIPFLREPLSYAFESSFNVAQLQFFFADAVLTNGTYYEFGTFIDIPANNTPTPVVSSGQMFNHALFSVPYVKSSGNDTTCEVDISIANL